MKRIIFCIGVLFLFLSLSSCKEKEEEYWVGDVNCEYFQVHVEDEDGNNLLDENYEGNILEKEMYVIYKGEKNDIFLGWPEFRPGSLAPEVWYEPYIAPALNEYSPLEKPAIFIGVFGRGVDSSVDLFIDGISHTLSFKSKQISQFDYDDSYFMDGIQQSNNNFLIVL